MEALFSRDKSKIIKIPLVFDKFAIFILGLFVKSVYLFLLTNKQECIII